MQTIRTKKVNSFLKEEISKLILNNKIKDPRIDGLITITDVEVSKDMQYAKVFISCIGSEEKRVSIISGLNHATGFIQKEIGKNMHTRYTPRLTFYYDNSLERGFRITKKINEIGICHEEHKKTEAEISHKAHKEHRGKHT
ncbi:MAG: 30S ribosome-binding factor RbfA [Spirochaetales bacterium]|nr:30S ribosome-binding factor RbfA [Spirochaetales bacterium]